MVERREDVPKPGLVVSSTVDTTGLFAFPVVVSPFSVAIEYVVSISFSVDMESLVMDFAVVSSMAVV
jgi:hypothetical protein